MTDLYGKEIKVGQKVAFSAMTYGGSSNWISVGEVIEVWETPKRKHCRVRTTLSGSPYRSGDLEFTQDESTFNNKILILNE